MANKKQKEKKTEIQAPKLSVPTLTYEEYYQTLMLAKKIRLENKEAIDKAKTPKEKVQLLEALFATYQIPGTNAKEKEQIILLKVNIFMPDSEQFLIDYKSKYDKNIRLISEAYQIPAPFAISKVSEIGKYEKYLDRLYKEGGLGEVEITPNDSVEMIATLATSGALKPLYDPPVKETKSQQVEVAKQESKDQKVEHEPKKVIPPSDAKPEQPTLPSDSIPGIISDELLHHIDSMQKYCTRLLDNNEQLSKENDSLSRFTKELQSLVARLKQENEALKLQSGTLQEQVTSLTAQNTSLQGQLSEMDKASIPTSRSIAEETESERKLRQQIKDIEFTNQELVEQVKKEKEKAYHYRNRAIVAEAQLDQLQDGMQGIFKQVDELDISFLKGDDPKKKS